MDQQSKETVSFSYLDFPGSYRGIGVLDQDWLRHRLDLVFGVRVEFGDELGTSYSCQLQLMPLDMTHTEERVQDTRGLDKGAEGPRLFQEHVP